MRSFNATGSESQALELGRWRPALLVLLLVPYVFYVWFIIQGDQGPVDYETFMSIGGRLLAGEEVWVENSYYPMPYVMIFAAFRWLPRPLSMALWHLGPVVAALAISRWNPWVLLYAPLFGHAVGGQTAVFAMLGLWGYRRHADAQDWRGGAWLVLSLLKPQLGLVPLVWALAQWWKHFRDTRRLPRQAWVWALTLAVLYLPGFALIPDWPLRWLSQPRPVFSRALSGLLPRTLLFVLSPGHIVYWAVLLVLAAALFFVVYRLAGRQLSLDIVVLWGFVVSPLVHDYDLIQLVPVLETRPLRRAAVLLSLPGWLVIILAYGVDAAWYAFTIIASGLLLLKLYLYRQEARLTPSL